MIISSIRAGLSVHSLCKYSASEKVRMNLLTTVLQHDREVVVGELPVFVSGGVGEGVVHLQ